MKEPNHDYTFQGIKIRPENYLQVRLGYILDFFIIRDPVWSDPKTKAQHISPIRPSPVVKREKLLFFMIVHLYLACTPHTRTYHQTLFSLSTLFVCYVFI